MRRFLLSACLILPGLVMLSGCFSARDNSLVYRIVDEHRYELTNLPDSLLSAEEQALVRKIDVIRKTMVEVTDDGFTRLAADRAYFRENGIPMAFYRHLKKEIRTNNRTVEGIPPQMRVHLNLKENMEKEKQEFLADPEAGRRANNERWLVMHQRELLYDAADRKKAQAR